MFQRLIETPEEYRELIAQGWESMGKEQLGENLLKVYMRNPNAQEYYDYRHYYISVKNYQAAQVEPHEHKISVRASNNWRPVVEYEFYCRDCGDTIEKVFTLEMIQPDVRRSQLILTAAKHIGEKKAHEWGRGQKFDEFYRTDFAETLKQAIPQPNINHKDGITITNPDTEIEATEE